MGHGLSNLDHLVYPATEFQIVVWPLSRDLATRLYPDGVIRYQVGGKSFFHNLTLRRAASEQSWSFDFPVNHSLASLV